MASAVTLHIAVDSTREVLVAPNTLAPVAAGRLAAAVEQRAR